MKPLMLHGLTSEIWYENCAMTSRIQAFHPSFLPLVVLMQGEACSSCHVQWHTWMYGEHLEEWRIPSESVQL